MGDLHMPSLGADMDAGTLIAWHVKPGDVVARGQVVADVETDKGIVEIETWEGGVVDALLVGPGTKVPVGTVLARTRDGGAGAAAGPGSTPGPVPGPGPGPVPVPTPVPVPVPAPVPVPEAPTGRVMATPAARQLARERGLDVAAVRGTGPHGSITRRDVEQASAVAPAATLAVAPVATTPIAAAVPGEPSAMRRAIAAAMARSKREIPHDYLSTDLDVHGASGWLAARNATLGVEDRTLFATLLLKATALAVREVPEVNGFFEDGAFRPSSAVHLGVAIALRKGGLVAPAIHDVDRMTLGELQASLRDLTTRVRAGRLRASEMADPTLTVTSLGEQGVDSVLGVIYPPQVAIVGFGRPRERPWASGGMLGVRTIVTATLAADHRVSDGHRGALFLAAIGRHLEHPEEL